MSFEFEMFFKIEFVSSVDVYEIVVFFWWLIVELCGVDYGDNVDWYGVWIESKMLENVEIWIIVLGVFMVVIDYNCKVLGVVVGCLDG